MYRIFRRIYRNLPFLHDSLEQDLHNPLQRDRLPDTQNIELDFPVVSGSLAQNQAYTRRTIAFAFLAALVVCIGSIAVGHWVGMHLRSALFQKIAHLSASVGFACVAAAYLLGKPRTFFTLIQWFIAFHVALALLLLQTPALVWTALAVSAVLIADRVATNYLHLQTTAPMDRRRALTLRSMWRSRFGVRRSVRGSELYPLALALPLVFVAFLLAAEVLFPQDPLTTLLRLALCTGGILVGTLLIDWAAAFLYARPPATPRMMFRHLNKALVHWLTYNRFGITAPGVYQTPAGTCRQRWWMSFGLVLLAAGATGLLVGPLGPYIDVVALKMGKDSSQTIVHPKLPAPVEVPEEIAQKEQADEQQQPAVVLEPYQEQMLKQMPQEAREEYLKRLLRDSTGSDIERSQQQASPNQSADSGEDSLSGDSPEDESDETAEKPFSETAFAKTLGGIYLGLLSLAAPILGAILALAYLHACVFATTGRLVAQFGPRDSVPPDKVLDSSRWKELITRVQSSSDTTEKNSLLLGVNAKDNTPILVPRDVFTEHAHLLGDSGSGKTSIGIASILSQLIRGGECSVVVLDLKGDDLALFQGVREDAEKADRRFRWFTNQLERSTYAFNPMRQSPLQRMTLYQKVDMLTAAMGLQYGRDYGRAYYSDANARMLHAALMDNGHIDSFAALAALLPHIDGRQGIDRELRQAGAHLTAIVNRLADSEPLNVAPNNGHPDSLLDAAIEFTDVFRNPEVVYFHLTSTIGTTSSAEIARIALYSLLTAASAVPPDKRVQTFVVIDEFQRIVAGNIELLLQLARSLGIGIILAN